MHLMQIIQHKLAAGEANAFRLEINTNDAVGDPVNIPSNNFSRFEIRPRTSGPVNLAILSLSVAMDSAGAVQYGLVDSAADNGSVATITNMEIGNIGPLEIIGSAYDPRVRVSAPEPYIALSYCRGKRFTGHIDIDFSDTPVLLSSKMANPKFVVRVNNVGGSGKPAYTHFHCVAW